MRYPCALNPLSEARHAVQADPEPGQEQGDDEDQRGRADHLVHPAEPVEVKGELRAVLWRARGRPVAGLLPRLAVPGLLPRWPVTGLLPLRVIPGRAG